MPVLMGTSSLRKTFVFKLEKPTFYAFTILHIYIYSSSHRDGPQMAGDMSPEVYWDFTHDVQSLALFEKLIANPSPLPGAKPPRPSCPLNVTHMGCVVM